MALPEVSRPSCTVLLTGSELLDGSTGDLNLSRLSGILIGRGIEVLESRTVPDSVAAVSRAIGDLVSTCGLVVVSGGLGSTCDDVTAQAAGMALGRPLERSRKVERMLESWYGSRGCQVPDQVMRQAFIPAGAQPVENPCGTAPGLVILGDGKLGNLVLLPGFPAEAEALLPLCLDLLKINTHVLSSGFALRLWGVSESTLMYEVRGLREPSGTSVSVRPQYGRLDLVLEGSGADSLYTEIKQRYGDHVYADSLDRSLEEVVGHQFARRGMSLSVAESCTGGLVSKLLTDIPGASDWFTGGVTAYSNRLKMAVLGVQQETLELYGSVSSETACEMASGIGHLTGSSVSGAVTGIAGPGGAVPGKPVGTVFLAVFGPGERMVCEHLNLAGTREVVRSASASYLLGMFHSALSEEAQP